MAVNGAHSEIAPGCDTNHLRLLTASLGSSGRLSIALTGLLAVSCRFSLKKCQTARKPACWKPPRRLKRVPLHSGVLTTIGMDT